ncbi:MAG TPA: glycosyltransferase WbuB [Ignavibacteria bacterium]|nr:glycosyltransferase WbuB [Ignavibacteria bacterium]
MRKHILVISQLFYPENFRINDICSEWVKRGYKVTVITGIPNYPQGKFYPGYGYFKKRHEYYKGIEIIRLPLISRGKTRVQLVLNYFSFVISGFFWAHFTTLKADSVFIFEVSPMTQALPGVWFAKRRNIICQIYVQDLWPENVEIITGIKSRRIITPIVKMVQYIYNNCKNIFVTSKGFVLAIESRGVPKDKIQYWPQYAEDYYKPLMKNTVDISAITRDEKLNILFAGNIGEAQGLGILPEAALVLKKEGLPIRFNIIGDGRFKVRLVELIRKYKVDEYFNFIPRQPAKIIPEYMAAADVALITLKKSPIFSMQIPAKTQSYLACGKPILLSADGEVKDIIEEAKAGFTSPAEDVPQFVKAIKKFIALSVVELKLMGENAFTYYQEYFNKERLLDEMDKYLGQ